MNDIGKELYERVRADFERRLAADKHPPKDMRGVSDYSARVGRYLAEAIAANVTEDALPDRRLYYNIVDSILSPSLRTNYELVNDTAAEVQRLLDERRGLRIKPARADYPEERVHAVIGAASEEGIEFGKALRRMTSPAENITQSFADDFMQANAEQRSRAGFDTFIERQGGLNCCPWCAGLVGVFAYPKGLPKEVFARHDNCTCSVTYGTKGGARQNAWTKAKWNVPPVQEPHRMTAEEAAEKGAFAEPKRLTKEHENGIINSREYHTGLNSLLTEIKTALNKLGTPKEHEPVSEEYLDSLPKTDHVLSLFEALARTNPSLDSFNCSRCVPAYEMIRRGYDVIATLLPEGQQIEPIGLYDYKNIFVGSNWLKASGTGKEDVEQYLQDAGNGARVEISIRTEKFSHLFVAENDNGIIRFIDPQKNRKDVTRYFDEVLIGTTEYARIDNLPVSNLIRQCVEVVK